MTEKEKTIKIDSKYESSEKRESHKGGLKGRTLSILKSFRDRIAEYCSQTPSEYLDEHLKYMGEYYIDYYNKYLR